MSEVAASGMTPMRLSIIRSEWAKATDQLVIEKLQVLLPLELEQLIEKRRIRPMLERARMQRLDRKFTGHA